MRKSEMKAMGKWSMKHNCCKGCGTIVKPHNARGLCKSCYYKTPHQHKTQKKYRCELKKKVLKHYSGNFIECACCKEREIKFLGIDHINGCGVKRRKKEPSGSPIYIYI